MHNKILIVLIMLVVPILGQQQGPMPWHPSMVPEVIQTVGAIQGTWRGKVTANVPGLPVDIFEWTMDCRVVAQGAGALCTNTGRASIGTMDESCLMAFDPDGKAVHVMCVTSMGEVHDHKGHWKDSQTLEFEPLRGGMMGQPITETLLWRFPDAHTLDKISEVKTADGSVMRFEFKGQRQ